MSTCRIESFHGEYSFLSNFYYSPLFYMGLWFPHSEAAYQSQKCSDPKSWLPFTDENLKPGQSKHLGFRLKIRPDWDNIKERVMREVVRIKFYNPELRGKLIETGTAYICEGNWWHDNFFGVCNCPNCGSTGKNRLGIILMEEREYCKNTPIIKLKQSLR